MAKQKSEKVPAIMEAKFNELVALTDKFCHKNLNKDYAELSRKVLAALCRKRPSPLSKGRSDVWTCSVVYAIGQINFLSDRSQTPSMSMEELCRRFSVSQNTASGKAKQIRDALDMIHFNYNWMLPDILEDSSHIWLLSINGFFQDIRNMPRSVQEEAFRKGLIPYIPDDRKAPHPYQKERDELYKTYNQIRQISAKHQTNLAAELLNSDAVTSIAKHIGIIDSDGQVFADSEEDIFDNLAPAFDLAIYTISADGTNAIQRYVHKKEKSLTNKEKRVLAAMEKARFSVFRVERAHDKAGVLLSDTITGEEIWLMDSGLESIMDSKITIGMRIFKPADFWITTGVAVPTGISIINSNKKSSASPKKKQDFDCDKLAEEMYRGHFGEAA